MFNEVMWIFFAGMFPDKKKVLRKKEKPQHPRGLKKPESIKGKKE
jgi:hypothetical protein